MTTCSSSSGGSKGKSVGATMAARGTEVVAKETPKTTKAEDIKIPTPNEAITRVTKADLNLENDIKGLIKDSRFNINLNKKEIIAKLDEAKPSTAMVLSAHNEWHPELKQIYIKQANGSWEHTYGSKKEWYWSENFKTSSSAYTNIWNDIANAYGWLD